MNTLEKKILSKIDQSLPLLVIIAVSVLGAIIRFSLRGIVSLDASAWLLPWYEAIAENGLYEQVGDYNMLYQLLIWFMTKIPISPLYAYKALSCAFDYLLAFTAALLIRQVDKERSLWNSIFVYAAVLLSPVVFINSAAWAQCDAIFSMFAILGLYFFVKERYNLALISLGISFAFKLHAVFILPLYLFVYFTHRRFSVVRFALIPITMLIASSPLLFWGRNLLDTFSIYYNQTSTWEVMAANYPSFWGLLCNPQLPSHYAKLKTVAIIFTVCILAFLMLLWILKKYKPTEKNLIIMAFLLAYACVAFLPAMHERYGYLYEVCSIILAVLIPKTIPLCLGLMLMSLHSYGVFLFNTTANFTLLSFANIILFVIYILILDKELQKP